MCCPILLALSLRRFNLAQGLVAFSRPLSSTPKKLETGLSTISAGIPHYKLLLRIEANGSPTFGLLLYKIAEMAAQKKMSLSRGTGLNPQLKGSGLRKSGLKDAGRTRL